MEGKKKKNKKKKGNQAKQYDSTSTTEDVNQTKQSDSVSNTEVVIRDHDHATVSEMNQPAEAPINAINQSFGLSDSDIEQGRSKNFEANCEELQEVNTLVEKEIWSEKVGYLEEKTRYLQNQVGSCFKREEELQEKINKLEVEKKICSQKESILEERIKYLQVEVSSCIQREVDLEDKIGDLQSKNSSFTLREDGLEERVERMEDLYQSFALEKSSIKKMVSNLGDSNVGLQMQVVELKESRDSLEKENKHLTERISTLESRIQQLEVDASYYDSLKVHGEKERHRKEADVLVEPDVLNEESVAKVSEIHAEPESEDAVKATADDFSEFDENILESDGKIQSTGKAIESFGMNGGVDLGYVGQLQQIRLLGFDDSRISEDVVSVPLDDIDHGLKPTDDIDSEQPVPISDAPLIGAPFRLISFVTRYVSGADLVDRPKSRR